MTNKTKISVIINPIAGKTHNDMLPEILEAKFKHSHYDIEIRHTLHPNHACELAKEAVQKRYKGVLAVGGDGTINEVATALCGTDTALGIIPYGSGNGLARHLKIPLDIEKAIDIILDGDTSPLDYCTANDKPFFCTCGIGFDAQVSDRFAKSRKRGALEYVKSAIAEYLKYRPQRYKITTPTGVITEKAFIIACGNASQYGNNAYIAPNANIQDGQIDVTVILPITPIDTAVLGILLFSKHIDQDTNIISFRTPRLTIERDNAGVVHLDGEPIEMGSTISINCHPSGLKVFTPTKSDDKNNIFSTIESEFWNFVNSVRAELNI